MNKGVEEPPKPTEAPRIRTSGGVQVGILVSGVVGVVVGVAVVVTAVVICRSRQVHASSSSSSSDKADQYVKTSGDSLLEVPQRGFMLSTTTSPSCGQFSTVLV